MKPSVLTSQSTPNLPRSKSDLVFKDVHYNKNKTHELRVARIKAKAVVELDRYNPKSKSHLLQALYCIPSLVQALYCIPSLGFTLSCVVRHKKRFWYAYHHDFRRYA